MEYNGMKELIYLSQKNDKGERLYWLKFSNCNVAIQWMPEANYFSYPRSMPQGFAKELLETRVRIAELEGKSVISETLRQW
jgi:hypothetical protein